MTQLQQSLDTQHLTSRHMTGPRMALCLEQTLGHRTHGLNLQAALTEDDRVDVFAIEAPAENHLHLPWALRASLQARHKLRASRSIFDVSFFHTQSVSLFARSAGSRYLVSVDATPIQFDAVGQWYGHRGQGAALERWKRARYRSVFHGASGIVAWSAWAAKSLTTDYGADPQRILVAHPGAGQEFFELERPIGTCKPVILFVGGDFDRKGGPALLEAWRPLAKLADLVLVTDTLIPPEPGLRVERGVRPGDRLLTLYREADIFCLPTLGDCTPVVIGEAMAAGLPVITTSIGSNSESVSDGETGLLVRPGNAGDLTSALRRLLTQPSDRVSMGNTGRMHARERMDATVSARRILDFMRSVAS